MKPGERLAALEGLRGYAAFLVFLVHAFGLLAARLYEFNPDGHSIWGDADPLRVALVLIARSHYGVDLFFVLSGLFMADLAMRRWRGAGPFLWRRWLRIYPAYLVSSLVVAAISLRWFGQAYDAAQVAGNALLLQGFFPLGIRAVNPVSWSLSYEAAFYLAVPAIAAWLRARGAPGPLALAAAFCAIVLAATGAGGMAVFLAYFALFIPGIALGLMTDEARTRLASRVPLAAALAAWAAFTLAMKLEAIAASGPAYYFASGIAGGLLVLKACDAGGPLARLLSSAVPRWVGRYSYSFFLVHYIVVHGWGAWLTTIVPASERLAYSAAYLAGALALSLVAARLLWSVAERFYFRERPPAGAR